MNVYGASDSYYTGKLEAYLRYRGIACERGSPYPERRTISEQLGCIQHPVVRRDAGRWMTDSTPMILQLKQEHPDRSILLQDICETHLVPLNANAEQWQSKADLEAQSGSDEARQAPLNRAINVFTGAVPE